MPYKTKAERERENWMTLPEAIAAIRGSEKFDERRARRELLKALADGAFRSRRQLVRWERTFEITGPPPDHVAPPDSPPVGQEWLKAKIRWKTGKVLDAFGKAENGSWVPAWRTVWLRRNRVMELWSSGRSANSPDGPNARQDNVVSLATGSRGRPANVTPAVEAAMRSDLQTGNRTAKELSDMKEEVMASIYGASRDTCRKARKVVLSEIVDNKGRPITDN